MSFSGKAFSLKNREKEFNIFGKINDITRGCLRTGSAGLNLCYLAESKINLCLGKANKLWDIAAGIVIAMQAGASINYKKIDNKNFLIDFIAGSELSISHIKSKIDVSYFEIF